MLTTNRVAVPPMFKGRSGDKSHGKEDLTAENLDQELRQCAFILMAHALEMKQLIGEVLHIQPRIRLFIPFVSLNRTWTKIIHFPSILELA
jgi:hypothetical protein